MVDALLVRADMGTNTSFQTERQDTSGIPFHIQPISDLLPLHLFLHGLSFFFFFNFSRVHSVFHLFKVHVSLLEQRFFLVLKVEGHLKF